MEPIQVAEIENLNQGSPVQVVVTHAVMIDSSSGNFV